MAFEQFVSDGLEVTQFVRERLPGRDIFLLGHSWGSALGVHMVKRRPDLFSAFVGTGQFVSSRANEEANYEREIALARRSGSGEALAELAEIGPPTAESQRCGDLLRRDYSKTSSNGSA